MPVVDSKMGVGESQPCVNTWYRETRGHAHILKVCIHHLDSTDPVSAALGRNAVATNAIQLRCDRRATRVQLSFVAGKLHTSCGEVARQSSCSCNRHLNFIVNQVKTLVRTRRCRCALRQYKQPTECH